MVHHPLPSRSSLRILLNKLVTVLCGHMIPHTSVTVNQICKFSIQLPSGGGNPCFMLCSVNAARYFSCSINGRGDSIFRVTCPTNFSEACNRDKHSMYVSNCPCAHGIQTFMQMNNWEYSERKVCRRDYLLGSKKEKQIEQTITFVLV